ncbi:MAG: helix-turn-helix transcriptional regulator [Clostridiaceae bacterium]|nr:helix-turn-helix transcriptional regulator [Clostridiaceae bacterium]
MNNTLNTLMLGERLRKCRVSRKKTIAEFAELCGISNRYLSDIEHGLKSPKLDTFVRITNTAGVSADYLLQDSLLSSSKESLVLDALNNLPQRQKELLQNFILHLAASLE